MVTKILMEKISITLFFIFFLVSCSKDKLAPPDFSCDPQPTYNSDVDNIINSSCAYAGCHDGSSAPGNFGSYATLSGFLSPTLFERRALVLRDMPPQEATGPTSLTEEQIQILSCWVEDGYPEN